MAEAEWIRVLRAECQRTSQNKVATRLGRGASSTVINQVLNSTYKGSADRLRAKVEGVLMNRKVKCPVLGEISKARCDELQNMPFATTNPQRVAVFKACRNGCPHSRIGGD